MHDYAVVEQRKRDSTNASWLGSSKNAKKKHFLRLLGHSVGVEIKVVTSNLNVDR